MVENKAYHSQIMKLQIDLSVADNPRDKGTTTKRILKDKEGTIQLLKKKLEILTTWLIQTAELTKIEKEKEALNTQVIDYKARLLI